MTLPNLCHPALDYESIARRPQIHQLVAYLKTQWPLIFFHPNLKTRDRVPVCNVALSQNVEP